MCIGLAKPTLDDRTRNLLDFGACGVVLHGEAFGDPSHVAELIHAIKSHAARPIFVGVDQRVAVDNSRQTAFSDLPTGHQLAEVGDVELARHVGQLMGRELRAVGVDVTLGPCLEISSGKARGASLGSDAEQVAQLAAALIRGQQAQGVAACASLFTDTGRGPDSAATPRLAYDMARLDEVELRPFHFGIQARVAGIRLGQVHLDALDPKTPALLSRAIVFGLLRQRMGYRGMVMIDDVNGMGLANRYGWATLGALGVMSGADCFLCLKRPGSAFELIDAIERGVDEGTILPERLEAARRRIAPLLHRYVHDPGPRPDLSRLGGRRLDPGIDASTHVGPGTLTADED